MQSLTQASKYQILLVNKAVEERRFTSIASGFNHSQIKNKITMMLQKKSSRWARLKILTAVPVIVATLFSFSKPNIENKITNILQ